MKIFAVAKLRWAPALSVAAAAAVLLSGCGGGDSGANSGGGTGVVGDWTLYSYTVDGNVTYFDRQDWFDVLSLKSSGDAELIEFEKIGNVWVEFIEGELKWRTSGSTLYIIEPEREVGVEYRISGDKLIMSELDSQDGATYTRVNIADLRRSLGTVYRDDTRLSKSTAYEDLIWYSQSGVDGYIEFGSTWVYDSGNALARYMGSSYTGNVRYYTNDNRNRLFLVTQDCERDDNNVRRCTVSAPVGLDYSVTGSDRNIRLTINGDVWLPGSINHSPAESKRAMRPTALNKARGGGFIPPRF